MNSNNIFSALSALLNSFSSVVVERDDRRIANANFTITHLGVEFRDCFNFIYMDSLAFSDFSVKAENGMVLIDLENNWTKYRIQLK